MTEYIDKKELDIAFTDKCTGDCGCCQYWNADSCAYDCKLIHNFPAADVIPIPEGATNGDIIRAIFSDKVAENIKDSFFRDWFNGDMARLDEHSQEFLLDWWNEPYKRSVEE